ncbi:hypothetical protein [Altererythrobacter sp. ZODW24]|uniref:hypothetical protein n=1 Tax=Altererythrobacter sp. ZODW24 TaxID=2185142 RepID=UPI0013B3DEAD|nr:hypothetical protein [Altererythrobacter sp. ZODW24]
MKLILPLMFALAAVSVPASANNGNGAKDNSRKGNVPTNCDSRKMRLGEFWEFGDWCKWMEEFQDNRNWHFTKPMPGTPSGRK